MIVDRNDSRVPARPILRWAGSKKRALPNLSRHVPKRYNTYIEAFAGSGCLFFHLNPERAVLSDLNKDLIEFYRIICNCSDEVYDLATEISRTKETYYEVREAINREDHPARWAAMFFFLNRNCFNGLFRTNRKGFFNVPFSSSRVPPYPSRSDFVGAASMLSRCALHCIDFEDLIERFVSEQDFVYLDPPYYQANVKTFREYSAKSFCEDDFGRLVKVLNTINSRGAYFILSYPMSSSLKEVFSDWFLESYGVFRSIAGKAEARRAVPELLVTNIPISMRQDFGDS